MRWITFAGCVAAFAGLCWDAGVRLADAHPSLPMCRRHPEKHDGKSVWFNPVPVIATRDGSFDVRHWQAPVTVRSSLQPAVGTRVMVYGTFHRDGTVTAMAWQEEAHYPLKRRAAQAVSFLVVGVGILMFRRRFVWRDGAFHPR